MLNFEYQQPTKYIFGRGTENEAGSHMAELSEKKRVLIVYDTDRIEKNGLLARVCASLEAAGFRWWTLSGIVPNPRLDLVYKGVELVRAEDIDCVLAIGGGSVMDTGKAIAAGAVYDGDCADLIHGTMAEKSLPVGVILTLAATGSEGAMFAVISETDENGVLHKCAVMGEAIRPKYAIMNPELTFTVPTWQTACGSFDMMSHTLEHYFTTSENADLLDGMIEGIVRAVVAATPVALQEPDNYNARATLMWASTLCNNGAMGLGRIGDTSPHAIGENYGGRFDLTHGASIAAAFIPYMKVSYKKNLKKFVRFATRIWDIPATGSDEEIALAGIAKMEHYVTDVLHLPLTLSGLHVEHPEQYVDELTDSLDLEGWNETPGYCVSITREEAHQIYMEICR